MIQTLGVRRGTWRTRLISVGKAWESQLSINLRVMLFLFWSSPWHSWRGKSTLASEQVCGRRSASCKVWIPRSNSAVSSWRSATKMRRGIDWIGRGWWMMSSWLATSQELMQCKSQLMLVAHSRRWRPIALRRLMVPNFKAKVFDASHGGDFWRCSLQSCGERVTWIADECWWATMKWTAHVLGIPFLTHIHTSIPMTIHDFTTKQRTSRDAARSMKAGWSHWNAHDRVWLLTQIQVYHSLPSGQTWQWEIPRKWSFQWEHLKSSPPKNGGFVHHRVWFRRVSSRGLHFNQDASGDVLTMVCSIVLITKMQWTWTCLRCGQQIKCQQHTWRFRKIGVLYFQIINFNRIFHRKPSIMGPPQMAWFQWRKCGNMIPNVQHQLYQLYNRHWTQPYHEYQTSHVISMITPLWLVVSIGFTALFFGWQTIHGRYWRRLVRLHLPSKATSQQVYEALVNAAQNPEGSKAAGGWLIWIYHDLPPIFVITLCTFDGEIDNLLWIWGYPWALMGFWGSSFSHKKRRTWKPYVQNSSSSDSHQCDPQQEINHPQFETICVLIHYIYIIISSQ